MGYLYPCQLAPTGHTGHKLEHGAVWPVDGLETAWSDNYPPRGLQALLGRLHKPQGTQKPPSLEWLGGLSW